jgi:hypothetical protein|tara:strand:- start:6106 stop:6285 length:180 start_codon:yes stop_codon:yes gene_type:complete
MTKNNVTKNKKPPEEEQGFFFCKGCPEEPTCSVAWDDYNKEKEKPPKWNSSFLWFCAAK